LEPGIVEKLVHHIHTKLEEERKKIIIEVYLYNGAAIKLTGNKR